MAAAADSRDVDLLERTGLEQASLVRAGEVSSEELTRLYLDRIERLDPVFCSFVSVHRRSALAQARRRDAERRRDRSDLAAFHGVPIAIKDLNLVRGKLARFGSRGMAVPSPIDCRTTASLRRAGFVILGKTATSELGAMPVTEPDLHPPTRNPWDPSRTSGGSSGGAGAAVAAGLVPLAHGSDGAGSVRIPAALCHLFGLKPSRGRVPNTYGMRDPNVLYTCGALTRSVTDAAAMLDAIARPDPGVPNAPPLPDVPFAQSCVREPRGLRVRLTLHSRLAPTHPEIADALKSVASRLETLGHRVEETIAPQGSVDEFLPVYKRMLALAPLWLPWRAQPVTRWLREGGRAVPAAEARAIQRELATRILDAMGDADLWLTPTVPIATPEVGEYADLPPPEAFARAAQLGVYTATCNITGAPAATLPMGLMDGRWPMGAHLIGRVGDDATLLAVSHQLERAMPWRGRHAPGADLDPIPAT